MVLANVCSPALIYLVFSLTQVTIDTMHGHYNKAFIKLWVSMIFTLLLNHLCHRGLGLVSWIIVFIPFLLMSIIVTMLLVMFGLDPETGKLAIYDKTNNKVIKPPSYPAAIEMDMNTDPRISRSKTFDYKNFEEPSISEQQKDVLARIRSRRSDASDDSFDKEGKIKDDGSANYKRQRDLMMNTGGAEYDR